MNGDQSGKLVQALRRVVYCEDRWRRATESSDRLASDMALRMAAADAADLLRRYDQGGPAEPVVESGSLDAVAQWVNRHLGD